MSKTVVDKMVSSEPPVREAVSEKKPSEWWLDGERPEGTVPIPLGYWGNMVDYWVGPGYQVRKYKKATESKVPPSVTVDSGRTPPVTHHITIHVDRYIFSINVGDPATYKPLDTNTI